MATASGNGDLPSDETSDAGAVEVPAASSLKLNDEPLGFLTAALKRNFGESEVTSAVSVQFLLERVSDQRRDIERLKPFETRFYECDRDLQVERSKTKLGKAQDIVSSALMTIGGVGMGVTVKFIDTVPLYSTVAFVLCAGVVASGFYLKVGSR